MHGKATANKRRLEACKMKDKEGNLVTNRQRDIIIKAKKDCHFKYILSYKDVSKGSYKKKYIGTLRYLEYTYLININSFLFKIHEIKTAEY